MTIKYNSEIHPQIVIKQDWTCILRLGSCDFTDGHRGRHPVHSKIHLEALIKLASSCTERQGLGKIGEVLEAGGYEAHQVLRFSWSIG